MGCGVGNMKLTEWITKVNNILIGSRLIDTEHIKWEKSANGTKPILISVPSQNSGDDVDPLWAEVTAVIDANNYTCSIWTNRTAYEEADNSVQDNATVIVPGSVTLGVGDDLPIAYTEITDKDYICIQKLGGSGGSSIYYAKITAVTDANYYTASIYANSDLSDTPTTGKDIYVMALTDELAVNDVVPVKSAYVKIYSDQSVDTDCTTTVLNITSHPFSEGEQVRMTSGNTSGESSFIASVTTNSITLSTALSVAPAMGDTFDVYTADGYESIQNLGTVG